MAACSRSILIPIFPRHPNTLSIRRWLCSKPSPPPSRKTNPNKGRRSINHQLLTVNHLRERVESRGKQPSLLLRSINHQLSTLNYFPAPASTASNSTPSKCHPAS